VHVPGTKERERLKVGAAVRKEDEASRALRLRLQQGDAKAWKEALDDHGPQLLGYATRLLGNRSNAEEVVQDALVSVYKSIGSFEGRCSLKSWLFRAVHNKAIDDLRRRDRYVDHEGEDPDEGCFDDDGRWSKTCPDWEAIVGERLDARALVDLVRRELDGLPHKYREVLLLREVHGLDASEVCETLDISPGNLRIRIHRARKALRAAVEGALAQQEGGANYVEL